MQTPEDALTTKISSGIPGEVTVRMWSLIAEASDDPDAEETGAEPGAAAGGDGDLAGELGPEVWAAIKSDPGNVSLNTCKTEVRKLTWIRAVGLPPQLLADVAPKILAGWRSRAAVEAPSHLRRDHSDAVRWTLMAAYLYCRQREITDTLVDLLIATVHRINARAEAKTKEAFISDIAKKVAGKENILFKIALASAEDPQGVVEEVVYPAAGGLGVILDLLHEYRAKGPTYRQARQRASRPPTPTTTAAG